MLNCHRRNFKLGHNRLFTFQVRGRMRHTGVNQVYILELLYITELLLALENGRFSSKIWAVTPYSPPPPLLLFYQNEIKDRAEQELFNSNMAQICKKMVVSRRFILLRILKLQQTFERDDARDKGGWCGGGSGVEDQPCSGLIFSDRICVPILILSKSQSVVCWGGGKRGLWSWNPNVVVILETNGWPTIYRGKTI